MERNRDGTFMWGIRKPEGDFFKRAAAARRGWRTRRRLAKFFAEERARQLEMWPLEQLRDTPRA
jgi:hypothetical protein